MGVWNAIECWFLQRLYGDKVICWYTGFPGVGRNTFLSSPDLCFIIVFICDLFVSRGDPLTS